ncbi:hypothetical protein NP233_g5807 [Leucocoprinus birnbaumii]|uniref:Uncharacterized protein n=1 Tax=Leucocoprinus birnbaumii TaxID=56174 RepID=A0AAD5VUG9_9AGAR|nr:hypothetical protein NP233_g5807 [Leucocoprinus birnbaumii]
MPKNKHRRRNSTIQTFLSNKTSDPNAPATPAEVICVGTIDPASFEPAFYGDNRRHLSTGTRLDLVEPVECPPFQKDWPPQMKNLESMVSELCGRSGFERFVMPDRLRLSGHPIGATILALPPSSAGTTRHSVKPMVVQDAWDREMEIEEALEKLPGAVVAVTFDIHYRRGGSGVHEFNNCITKIVVVKGPGVDEKGG